MVLEAISFSFNLGIFTGLIWSILSLQDVRLIEKIKKIAFFLCFASFFYLGFFFATYFDTKIFLLKSIYFNGLTILFQMLLAILILLISKRSILMHAPMLSIIIAPYIFFLIFGMEDFYFWETKIQSYSLLKTQNPIIGLCALFLLLIKPNKIQIATFFFFIGLLFYHVNPLKAFPFPEIQTLYYRYIPHEFFLKENAYVFEENSGIYTEKKVGADDVLYKFTMRPIRKVKLPLKQEIQNLISTFEFPIVVAEGNIITLLELSRSYNKSLFKVIFQINNESQVIGEQRNFDSSTIKIEGPIF